MGLAEVRRTARTRKGKLVIWLIVLAALAITFASVAIPVFIVLPFKPETPEGLSRAYLLRQWSPIITVLVSLTVLGATLLVWPVSKWWLGRPLLAIILLLSGFLAWFSRQNYFEWMFHPAPSPLYAKASEADFLTPSDMVLGVEINHDEVAYPLRLIGYHHVVNDVVGGVPIVATY